MKKTLFASVALACLIGAPAFAQLQSPVQEAQAQAPAPKPDAGAAQKPTGAGEKPSAPASGAAPIMREEKPTPAARSSDAGKAEDRPGRAAETGKAASPGERERKADAPKAAGEKTERGRDADRTSAPGKGEHGKNAAADDKNRAGSDRDEMRDKADRGKDGADRSRASTDRAHDSDKSRDNARSGRDEMRTGDRGDRRELNDRQRSRLSTYFERHKGPRADRADFSISVGARIPTRVRIAPLPREIIEIVPEYRGYEYVVVEDEIVIIRPGTREIVTVIPASTSAAARGTRLDPCGGRS